jgi:hypothetical protein
VHKGNKQEEYDETKTRKKRRKRRKEQNTEIGREEIKKKQRTFETYWDATQYSLVLTQQSFKRSSASGGSTDTSGFSETLVIINQTIRC